MKENNLVLTVAASSIRFRRSLELFQKVVLKTRVLFWDEKAFYMEQRFVDEEGFVYAIVLTKNHIILGEECERYWRPEDLVYLLHGDDVIRPKKSEDLDLWIKYNKKSSELMKTAIPTFVEEKQD